MHKDKNGRTGRIGDLERHRAQGAGHRDGYSVSGK